MEKILLIDDDYSNLDKLSKLLESKKYQVYIAQDGKKGLDLARLILPSLIICGTKLDDCNGFDILDNLSRSPQTAVIPIILIAPRFISNEFMRAMELCADSYLIKPINPKVLLNIIERKLSKIKILTGNKKEKSGNTNHSNNHSNSKLNNNSSLLIEIGRSPKLIKIIDIEHIIVEGDYTNAFIVGQNKVLVRRPLKVWEEILPEDFIRIHRSIVININSISSIEKWYKRVYRIHMYHSKEVFTTSQRYTVKIRSRLKI